VQATKLAEVASEVRTQRINDCTRKLAPSPDEALVPGVKGVVLRYGAALYEAILVMELSRLESPVLLEVERACAALAAPVIKSLEPALAGAPH
jgi:hypothetical protein